MIHLKKENDKILLDRDGNSIDITDLVDLNKEYYFMAIMEEFYDEKSNLYTCWHCWVSITLDKDMASKTYNDFPYLEEWLDILDRTLKWEWPKATTIYNDNEPKYNWIFHIRLKELISHSKYSRRTDKKTAEDSIYIGKMKLEKILEIMMGNSIQEIDF